eukprot:COSAG06_NODE_47951_length_335_cov_1.453390_1_plen_55_part_01
MIALSGFVFSPDSDPGAEEEKGSRNADAGSVAVEPCHHYVNGGPAEVGATTGVQW